MIRSNEKIKKMKLDKRRKPIKSERNGWIGLVSRLTTFGEEKYTTYKGDIEDYFIGRQDACLGVQMCTYTGD
jgi:hypothetical protein